MTKTMRRLSGWGNYPVSSSMLERPERIHQLQLLEEKVIPRGLGRSYGDAALNEGNGVILMERLNRFIAFDEVSGIVHAEAGVLLSDIIQTFLPRKWFLPVTPGTKAVTLGGCFACDVHGKNHHRDGAFSQYVTEIELLLADGSKRICSPSQNGELFWAAAGGMGLTGIITEIKLQLIPVETAYMQVRHEAAANLAQLLQILQDSAKDDKYSVAWLDGNASAKNMGRGIVMTGHHASVKDLPAMIKNPLQLPQKKMFRIPFQMPSWCLNNWNVRLFNSLYFSTQSRKRTPFTVDCDAYFYPLDAVGNWNALYGAKGFIQYQFVVPENNSERAISEVFERMLKERRFAYLAVLKRFGKEGPGLLSFPFEGYTLALDFPLAQTGLLKFLDELDELVLKSSGRVYLAKDARMQPETFKIMYPRFPLWHAIKAKTDPASRFCSDLSRRLRMEALT